jgi:hypothetical protein
LETATVLPPEQVKVFPASLNVTVPSLTVELDVTVAVSVTELPGDEVYAVVGLAASEVVVLLPVGNPPLAPADTPIAALAAVE